ncbi:hypothetical protein D7V80_20075 [Corallococcus sp. CA054B]|uniref:hypothetical protein n=1 Tax=Corallococcus sp. CA054B TaxID=2316734 RepID=UPI000EA2F581|nr:hypothetical protein [Corallococcus sp. CA054B]RKG66339.1 hypothetical protein D7V80_20075 [Corallococcus sp. CA054B]
MRRQHCIFGHFLGVEAWRRGLDCIVVERKDLAIYLGIKKFKSARVEALLEDLAPWFWFKKPYYRTNAPDSLSSIFLARVPIEEHLPRGSMRARTRVKKMEEGAPTTELLNMDGKPLTEEQIVTQLARLAAGLSPKGIPPK